LQTMPSAPDKLALTRLVRQFVRGPQLHDEPSGYGEVLKKSTSETCVTNMMARIDRLRPL
jgi:hypothetical protein